MSTRSKKEYPFKVTTMIPKGSSIGYKHRDSFRHSYFKTKEQAQKEVDTWRNVGYVSKCSER